MDKSKKLKAPKTPEEIEILRLESIKVGEKFIEFYKSNLELSKADFDDFIKANEQNLPLVFRVNKLK